MLKLTKRIAALLLSLIVLATAAEQAMLSTRQPLRADVLKVGHHGSHTSTTTAFLDSVRPSTAVISCGGGNSFGHPHKETLWKLSTPERRISVYRTDRDGTVVISTDGQRVTLPAKR